MGIIVTIITPTMGARKRFVGILLQSNSIIFHVFAAMLLGESGIRDGGETDVDCGVVPIDPASWMPVADLTITHKRVEALGEAVKAKHPVLDGKLNGPLT